jgi:hypothetical protein
MPATSAPRPPRKISGAAPAASDRGEHDGQPVAVVEPPENEVRGDAARRREGEQQRNRAGRHRARRREVEADQLEGKESRGEESRPEEEPSKRRSEIGDRRRRPFLQARRKRKAAARQGEAHQGEQRRDRENREADAVAAAAPEDQRHQQRAEGRSRFVERRVERVDPAGAEGSRRVRQHGLHGRLPDPTADALGEHQHGRRRPGSRESQRRHREQVDHVAEERERPVPARAVGDVPRKRPHRISEKLAEARDDARGGGRRAEGGEKRTVQAAAALVRHVREEVDDAEREDERERRRGEVEEPAAPRHARGATATTTSRFGPWTP